MPVRSYLPARLVAALLVTLLVWSSGFVPVALAIEPPVPTPSPAASRGPGEPGEPGGGTPAAESAATDRVEVVARRTESSRTFRRADGSYEGEFFTDPIHYRPAGEADWRPINLDFVAARNGRLAEVTEAPVRIAVGEQPDGMVSVERDGHRIALRLLPVGVPAPGAAAPSPSPSPTAASAASPEPSVSPTASSQPDATSRPDATTPPEAAAQPSPAPSGSAATEAEPVPGLQLPTPSSEPAPPVEVELPAPGELASPAIERHRAELADVVPGVDLRVFAQPYGARTFLVLDEPPATSSFTFHVTAPGLTLREADADELAFVDDAGSVVATVPAPYAVDSTPDELTGGGRTTTDVSHTIGSLGGAQTITVSVDPAWLSSAVYPVYIDPTVVIYNPGNTEFGDTFVNQGAPTTNYRNYQRPDSPTYYEMWLGLSPSNSTYYNEAFLKFDLTSIEGTAVQTSTLQVHPYHQYYDAPTATNTWLRRVTQDWQESITWNTKPAVTTTDTVVAGCVEGQQCSFDITALTRNWLSGTSPNYGVRLDENGNGVTYWKRLIAAEQVSLSGRPRLIVAYHDIGGLGRQAHHRFESFDLGAGDEAAVNVGNGNLHLAHPIVALPYRGGTLDLALIYNSRDTASAGTGAGWRLSAARRLEVDGSGNVTFVDADGSRHIFSSPTGTGTVTYTRPSTLYATLSRDTTATPDRFTLTYRDQTKDVFDELAANTGYLKEHKDRHGNTVTFGYTGTQLTSATDPEGRSVSFAWTGANLTSITDWASITGGIVQVWGSGNRSHRFFYDASGQLAGWADALNTSGDCANPADPPSHVTCLTYTGGLLTKVTKNQTYTTLSGSSLGSASRDVDTTFAYTSGELTSVTDGTSATTSFSHPATGQTQVVRPGTPASDTIYTLISPTDALLRISSIKRKLGTSTWIEQETLYDNLDYPTEPTQVTDNKGGTPQRVTTYGYQNTGLGLLTRIDELWEGSTGRLTTFAYNGNNDLTQRQVMKLDATGAVTTRYCYTSDCTTSGTGPVLLKTVENYIDGTAGGANGHLEDVTTSYQHDAYGQRTRENLAVYAAGGTLLHDRVTGWTYDSFGNVTSEMRNYADGDTNDPDDSVPNAATNARTDLTTVYGYDTAGNRTSVADPRRALGSNLSADDWLTRTTYDALNQPVATRLPTTKDGAACSPDPACREATTTYDEFGLVRSATDHPGLVTATRYDELGRALEQFEQPVGGVPGVAALMSYDAQGRLLTARDREQSKNTAGPHTTPTTTTTTGPRSSNPTAPPPTPATTATTASTGSSLARRGARARWSRGQRASTSALRTTTRATASRSRPQVQRPPPTTPTTPKASCARSARRRAPART